MDLALKNRVALVAASSQRIGLPTADAYLHDTAVKLYQGKVH